MTPAQLRRLIAQAEADEATYRQQADLARSQIAAFRVMLEEAERLASTSISQQRSMLGSKMELQNEKANKRVRIAATMTEDATEAKRALLEAGLTPQDVAKARGVGRSTVDAWCRGTRSIPSADRDWLKSKHGIPVRVWKKQA